MYTTKTPEILKALASDLTWNKSREERCVYLTFDDGPAAGVTDEILDILHQFSAKATFLLRGRNGGEESSIIAPHKRRRTRFGKPHLQARKRMENRKRGLLQELSCVSWIEWTPNYLGRLMAE